MSEVELNLDLDNRLEGIHRQALELDLSYSNVVRLLRLAYVKGHQDALTEKNPRRFYTFHGFTPPKRNPR